MPFGMLSALKPIFSSIMSEVPAKQGNAVQSNGVQGSGLDFPGPNTGNKDAQDNNATQTGNSGLTPDALSNQQSTSPGANVVIDDATFYVLKDPDQAEGTRHLGLHLREGMHRGRQVDTLTSQLHTTRNDNQTLRQQQLVDQAHIKELETQATVRNQLEDMGVSSPSVQNSGTVTPMNQQGVQPPQGTLQQQPQGNQANLPGAQESWNYETGTPGAYGYDQQAGMPPQTQQQLPVPPAQNGAPFNPEAFAQQLLKITDQLVEQKLGNMDSRIQETTEAGIRQLRQEQQAQEQISSTLQAARVARGEQLDALNLPSVEVKNILDLEDMGTVLTRESELLLTEGGPSNVAVAQEKLRQAATLQTKAANDRAAAQIAFQESQADRTFQDNFETDPFAAMGVKETPVDYDLTSPRDIEAANRASTQKAIELAEARERVESQTGRTL